MTNRNRNYVNGRAFEYMVKADLEKRGYLARRSPGSKSVVDLIAYHRGRCLLVQCKRGSARASKEEKGALLVLAITHDATALIAEKRKARAPIDYQELRRDGSLVAWGVA